VAAGAFVLASARVAGRPVAADSGVPDRAAIVGIHEYAAVVPGRRVVGDRVAHEVQLGTAEPEAADALAGAVAADNGVGDGGRAVGEQAAVTGARPVVADVAARHCQGGVLEEEAAVAPAGRVADHADVGECGGRDEGGEAALLVAGAVAVDRAVADPQGGAHDIGTALVVTRAVVVKRAVGDCADAPASLVDHLQPTRLALDPVAVDV